MKGLLVALGLGAMLMTYGIACVRAGINHDISTAIIAGLGALATGVYCYWSGKRAGGKQ